MNPTTYTASAYVPGHITGLFRIHDESDDPLHRGSTGAGFSVSIGTKTTVSITAKPALEVEVEYNKQIIDAPVTYTVVKRMSETYRKPFKARVIHESALPIGVGFGASGAGALGTALSLCSIIAPEEDKDTIAQYAHYAEVINHAGLGDVIAQTHGGIEIRTKPGAPGIGNIAPLEYTNSLHVVLAGAPGLDTKDVLTDPDSRARINKAGESLVHNLVNDPTIENFAQYSREFTNITELKTERVGTALTDLDQTGLVNSSMVMLGDSVFCFCQDDEITKAESILSRYWDSSEIISTTISNAGGSVV
ncbi:MAG: pantoate kinase [Candidatus Thorarchaeota archaeon]